MFELVSVGQSVAWVSLIYPFVSCVPAHAGPERLGHRNHCDGVKVPERVEKPFRLLS